MGFKGLPKAQKKHRFTYFLREIDAETLKIEAEAVGLTHGANDEFHHRRRGKKLDPQARTARLLRLLAESLRSNWLDNGDPQILTLAKRMRISAKTLGATIRDDRARRRRDEPGPNTWLGRRRSAT